MWFTDLDSAHQVDVEPLIEHLVNKSREEEERQNAGMKGELEAALTLKQETEAKLAHAQAEIARLQVRIIIISLVSVPK